MTQSNKQTLPSEPDLGVFLVIGGLFLSALWREVSGSATIVYVGDFNLTVSEVCLVLLGFDFVRRPKKWQHDSLIIFLVSGLFTLYLLALIRGVLVSPYDAFFSMRANAIFPFTLMWSLFVPPTALWSERIQRLVVKLGLMLAAVVALRTVMGPSFMMIAPNIDDADVNDGGRALSAQGSMILACAAVLITGRYIADSYQRPNFTSLGWIPAALISLAELLTKQGTATVAMLAALAITFSTLPGKTRLLRFILISIILFPVLVITLLADDSQFVETLNSVLPSNLQFDFEQRAANLNTRQQVWDGLLNDIPNWSFLSRAIGLPAGVRPDIWVFIWNRHGTPWEVSIHSMYYGILPVQGIGGLLLLIFLLSIVILTNFKNAFTDFYSRQVIASIGLAWTSILVVLGFSYELRNESVVFLACALAAISDAFRKPGERIREATRVVD